MNLENLQNILNSGDVVRYHTTPRVRPQTVAQHAWGAALIYRYLVGVGGGIIGMRDLLVHDAAEAYVGDVPAPIKELVWIQSAFAELEEHVLETKFGLRECRQTECEKLADKLEALYWTWRDGGADARTLNRGIAAHIADILKELSLTEAERARAEELLKAWSL